MSREEEKKYQSYCAEKTLQIHVTQKRLSMYSTHTHCSHIKKRFNTKIYFFWTVCHVMMLLSNLLLPRNSERYFAAAVFVYMIMCMFVCLFQAQRSSSSEIPGSRSEAETRPSTGSSPAELSQTPAGVSRGQVSVFNDPLIISLLISSCTVYHTGSGHKIICRPAAE